MKQSFLEMINNHLESNKTTDKCKRRPYFEFKSEGNKYEISIQASEYHYCEPRGNNTYPYEEVELGFPSFLFSDNFINKYAEDRHTPKDTVYPYVPVVELAEELESIFNGEVVWITTS